MKLLTAVSNPCGSRDRLCGRQFFHGLWARGDGFCMILIRSVQPRPLTCAVDKGSCSYESLMLSMI